ncbi:hypothetical protein Tco_0090977 [Tanacetum coccineum]
MPDLLFVDQHNMVACLERIDRNANFHEIVDFLTTSSIHYALTVSPTIYVSYIEQFWNTAHSQTVNDVKQIHATVDGKTIVISESSVRSDLHFNDEDGITCLTNETIFENLALMGYESDSDKLTFQKALFSPQWKYLIHTILHCLSSKSTSWNEFSTNIASTVICLANGQKFNFSKLIFDGMLRNLDTNTKKFLMYPRFLQLFLNNPISLVEPFNDIYKTPVHTKKVFTNMERKGKDFSGRITLLFASMLAPLVVECEGSGQPTKPQPTPSTTQPIIENKSLLLNHPNEDVFKEWDDRVVKATTTAASLDATHASGNITKTQSTAMSNDPLSQEIGSGDRPRCQEAMGGVIAQTRSERASKHSYVSPLPGVNTPERGYTPGSKEGRPYLHELMAICTKLSDRVLDLEKEKDAQAVEILKLKNIIKKLERKAKSSIPPQKKRLYKQINSSDNSLGKENAYKQGRNDSNKTKEFNLSDKGSGGTEVFDDTTAAEKDVNAAEPVSTVGDAVTATRVIPDIDTAGPSNVSAAGDIFEDEMMTIADTLVAIRSTRPRTTSIVIRDVEEEPRRATPVPTIQSQDKEDQAHFEREQRITRERAVEQEAKDAGLIEQMEDSRMLVDMIAERKRFFAAQRAAEQRSKPPIKAQMRNRMCTYLKNQAGYNHNQLKGRSYDEVQKIFDKAYKQVNSFIPMDYDVVKESGKKDDSSSKEAGRKEQV